MGANGADGQVEGESDVFVAELFLMIEDEDGTLGFGELHEGAVDGFEDLLFGELLLGGGAGLGDGFDGIGGVVVGVEGRGVEVGAVFAAALPLVLGYVEDDA
jgi:hypothetical protein